MLTQQEFVQIMTSLVTAGRHIPVLYDRQPVVPLFSALEILKSYAPDLVVELNFDLLSNQLQYNVRTAGQDAKPGTVLTLVPPRSPTEPSDAP